MSMRDLSLLSPATAAISKWWTTINIKCHSARDDWSCYTMRSLKTYPMSSVDVFWPWWVLAGNVHNKINTKLSRHICNEAEQNGSSKQQLQFNEMLRQRPTFRDILPFTHRTTTNSYGLHHSGTTWVRRYQIHQRNQWTCWTCLLHKGTHFNGDVPPKQV